MFQEWTKEELRDSLHTVDKLKQIDNDINVSKNLINMVKTNNIFGSDDNLHNDTLELYIQQTKDLISLKYKHNIIIHSYRKSYKKKKDVSFEKLLKIEEINVLESNKKDINNNISKLESMDINNDDFLQKTKQLYLKNLEKLDLKLKEHDNAVFSLTN